MIGTTLGHYRIVSSLGKGGMGEVYAAEDTRLGRTVALKVLPAGLDARPDDLERFAREAKSVAALNHRAIVTLYAFEEAGGRHFITMELVEGRPLSERLPANGLPFDQVIAIGIEMADAMAAAHARGIVHRDLKPANVLLRDDGQVKILDFGLAKLRPSESAAAELPTQMLTGEGRIVGTVAYMSPEQAEGRDVDHRSDIFSLGIVLYELATGQRPFQGDTNMSVLSSVMKDQPKPVTEINPALPPAFARVLKVCLQKDPERRYQSAKDLRNELQLLKEELASGEMSLPAIGAPAAAAPAPAPAPALPAHRWPLVAAAALVVAAVATAFVFWSRPPATTSGPLVLQHTRLTAAQGQENMPVLSPDGKWFLYVSGASGNADIYLQSVGGQTPINLTDKSPANDIDPAYSPDGQRIAFFSTRDGGGIYVMGNTGEAPRRIVAGGRTPSWSPDGKSLVYSTVGPAVPTSRGITATARVVNVDTGETRDVTTQDAVHPVWSPNGRFIAFWGLHHRPDDSTATQRDIFVVSAEGGTAWAITDDPHVDWSPSWAPDSSAIYFVSDRGGSMNLWRIAVDPNTGRAVSTPEAVTTPAGYVGLARMGANGRSLIYESRETTSNIHRASFDAARLTLGAPEPVTTGSRTFRYADLSPDGRFLVLGTGFLQQEDLYISRGDGSELRQLTTDAANDRQPSWSPNGSVLAFYSDRSGKYEIWTATPSGQLTQISNRRDFLPIFPVWSPSGRWMTATDANTATVIFDPSRSWSEQTLDRLPPIPGPRVTFSQRVVWSPDEQEIAGPVDNIIYVYNLETRQYRQIPNARAQPVAWLRDGRILGRVSRTPALTSELIVIDPQTGESRQVAWPDLRDLPGQEIRLSQDEKTIFFSVPVNEGDVWMVTLGAK